MTISCRDALAYRQVTTISWKNAVRYIDNKLHSCNKLKSCIVLQAGNYNKLQTCSEIQKKLVTELP